MLFGLCNAPSTFQCLMELVLVGLNWEICLAYLDDVVVFGRSWEQHLQCLRTVSFDLTVRSSAQTTPQEMSVLQTESCVFGTCCVLSLSLH